uniref:Uncharacterized protein n=1 Tax=Saimiri boliviensis boliviensis TaxID=39432 RepID=A0A2K6SLN2_SAIBB
MGPLCPRWLSGLEKAPCPPLEPRSRADCPCPEERQMGCPVNSLISNVNQIQAHDIR